MSLLASIPMCAAERRQKDHGPNRCCRHSSYRPGPGHVDEVTDSNPHRSPEVSPYPMAECLFSGKSLPCLARRLGVASSGGNAQTEMRKRLHPGVEVLPSFLHAGARDGGGCPGFPWFELHSWRLFAYPTGTPRRGGDDADLGSHLVGLSQTAAS